MGRRPCDTTVNVTTQQHTIRWRKLVTGGKRPRGGRITQLPCPRLNPEPFRCRHGCFSHISVCSETRRRHAKRRRFWGVARLFWSAVCVRRDWNWSCEFGRSRWEWLFLFLRFSTCIFPLLRSQFRVDGRGTKTAAVSWNKRPDGRV